MIHMIKRTGAFLFKIVKGMILFSKRRKFVAAFAVVLIVGGVYFGYPYIFGTSESVQYVTRVATKGSIEATVTGSGQVSSSSEVEVKPKVSGTVVSVNVSAGDVVHEGDIIATLDTSDAVSAVNEAKVSLEAAELDLALLAADSSLEQAKEDVEDARYALEKVKLEQESGTVTNANTVQKAYDDAYTDLASVFMEVPDIVTNVHDMLLSDEIADNEVTANSSTNAGVLLSAISSDHVTERDAQIELITSAEDAYAKMKTSYDEAFSAYKGITRSSGEEEVSVVLDETTSMLASLSDTLKATSNMYDHWVSYCTDHNVHIYNTVTSYRTSVSSYITKTNAHYATITNAKKAITAAEQTVKEAAISYPYELSQAERTLKEKKNELENFASGQDKLDIKTKQLAVTQKRNVLTDAKNDLADHYIRAPFDGVVTVIDVERGEEVSASTGLASVIGEQQIAEISLNEVDVSQIEVGQKVNFTFSALPGASVLGTVVEVDIVGEASSGVVSYGVKIAFDEKNDAVKPGMSTDVTIVIASKDDAIVVPLSAVETVRDRSIVKVLENGAPVVREVTTGIGNDTMIEIVSGIEEGDRIVIKTTTGGSAASSEKEDDRSSERGMMGGVLDADGPPGGGSGMGQIRMEMKQ